MSIPVAPPVARSLAALGRSAGVIPDATLGVGRDAAALRGRAIVSVAWRPSGAGAVRAVVTVSGEIDTVDLAMQGPATAA